MSRKARPGRSRAGVWPYRGAFAGLAAAAALTFAGAWAVRAALLQDPALALEHVTVAGGLLGSEASALAQAGVKLGAPLLALDLARMAARLGTRYPYARIAVERVLPRSLRITAQERAPYVQVQPGRKGARVLVLDEEGYLVEAPRSAPRENLPLIVEAEKRGAFSEREKRYRTASLEEWHDLDRLLARHRTLSRFPLSGFAVSRDGAYALRFAPGFEIRLRKPFQPALKTLAAASWFQGEEPLRLDYVDLRFGDIAVRFKETFGDAERPLDFSATR